MASEAELASINIRLMLIETRLGALESDVFPPRKVPRLNDPEPPHSPPPPPPAEPIPPPPTAELISQESTEE